MFRKASAVAGMAVLAIADCAPGGSPPLAGATLCPSSACSSVEERRPSKPLVGGSNPSRRNFLPVAERKPRG
jgi:hypothetical protein